VEGPAPKKCILILLDGIGDRSYEHLGNQTPLQAAKTPNLDKLAAGGANGLFHASLLGQALPSENAHFVLFGYDLSQFPGRGVLEALGAGIDLGPKDVAVLSHFVSLRESDGCFILEEGKPKVQEDEISELVRVVSEHETGQVFINFNRTERFYGVITLSGNVAPFITDSDPFVDGKPLIEVMPWSDYKTDPASQNAASVLKDYLLWANGRLKDHPVNRKRTDKGQRPVNGLVTQRAGQLKQVIPFAQRYGLRGLSISSGVVYWGLCAYIGMESMKVSDTADPGKDMAERLKLARAALNDYDFVHVHTKTPDEAAHTKNPDTKKSVIESLDRGIGAAIGPLMDDPEVFIIITGDHSTPSSGPLIHSGESVPVTFFGRGVRRDVVNRFDEISVAPGALGNVRGWELMYLVLNHLNRSKLQGIMDTPEDQPYWPGDYEPFRIK